MKLKKFYEKIMDAQQPKVDLLQLIRESEKLAAVCRYVKANEYMDKKMLLALLGEEGAEK